MGERREHPAKRTNPDGRSSRPTGSRTLRSTRATAAGSTRTPRPAAGRRPRPTTTDHRTDRPGSRTQRTDRTHRTDRTDRAARRSERRRNRGPRRIPLGSGSRRVRIVGIVMAFAVSICAGRLLQLQGFDSAAYGAIATADLTTTTPLLPARGEITDRDGSVLAGTEPAVDITADPTLTSQDCGKAYFGDLCGLAQATRIAQIIGSHTHIDQQQTIATLMRHDTRFAYVKKKVPADVYTDISNALEQENLPGIYRENDPIRTYPGGTVASNVIGFVGADNKGRAGLEYTLNSSLSGVEGKESYESAPNGSRIPLGQSSVTPAKNGVDYQLTIDSGLQWVVQRRLDAAVTRAGARDGMAITMDVTNGQILAMAQSPGFDSAHPGAAKPSDLGNRVVSQLYEPGSVEKVLTSAALIESGTTDPETRVRVPSTIASGGGRIKDAEVHGTVHYTMRGVIANSSNIGTVLMARQMNKAKLHDYLSRFGLGRPTGIDLPGEASGLLPPADMKDYTRDQIAFGQGLSVTAVQEASAIAGIVNGGIYHTPSVIKSASNADGSPVPVDHPSPRRIISADTSAKVRDLMQAVVTHNSVSQQFLMLDHYSSGGKTGTAQRYNARCGCYRGYVTSFIGFAPLNNPKILTYVVIDDPKYGDSGTGTAGPAYGDIMNFALPRYGIVPDQKNKQAGARRMNRPLEW